MLEIVIGSSSGHVYVFTWNGLLATGWPVETGERIEGGPLLVDAEGDGSLDIVLGAGNHLYIWDREGHPLNGWPLELDSQIRASCAAADMDADGDIELACCTSNGSIHVRDVSGPGVQPNTAWTCFSRDTSRSGAIPCHQPAPVIHAVYVIPNQPAWYLLAIATDPRGLPLVVHTASPGSAPITLLPITNGMFGMSITPQLAQQIERGIQVWAESTAGYTSSLWPYLPGCQTSEPDQAPPGGTPMRDLPIILGGGYGLSRFNEHGGSCSLTVAILAAADAPIREVKVLHEGLDTGLRLLDDGISGDNSPNDGIYGLKASLGPGMTIPENPLLIEIVAVDNNGQTSNTWPALPVPVHH